MKKSLICLLGLFVLITAGTSFIAAKKGLPADQGQVKSLATPAKTPALNRDFGRMPVYFVPNQGQVDGRVNFYIQGKDKTIYFAPDGVTFVLSYSDRPADKKDTRNLFNLHPENREYMMDKNLKRWTVKMDFEGARKDVKPEGLDKTGAVVSYFKGKPESWRTGLHAYSRIIYRNLWPGIDLVYKGEMNRLKYEFVVHPGADPEAIRLALRGADRVSVGEAGKLKISTPGGSFEDETPVAYQNRGEKRVKVSMTYKVREESGSGTQREVPSQTSEQKTHHYGFEVGIYDKTQDLVLDPATVLYCGYIGGLMNDVGHGIVVDASGNAYITGWTDSYETTFPERVGPDLTFNGNWDAFVAKVNPTGTSLVYCGYIGGASLDKGTGIAVDGSGSAYITGPTSSDESTFPVKVGPDLTYNGGTYDAFVAKVNPSGTNLVYCGYIGGASEDWGQGMAVDGSGNAYITGYTYSDQTTFPVMVGPDMIYNGGEDAFVAKVNPSGTGLVYCGYIGGAGDDVGFSSAVDGSGNAYITGYTNSDQTTFPVMVGPDLTYNGGPYEGDAFVAKVNPSGTGLVYCGYIGGAGDDIGFSTTVDGSGNAYITGIAGSDETTFPVTVGPDLTYGGSYFDAFVAKVNPDGTGLVYCGYIGGSSSDYGEGIAIDGSGNAYIIGETMSDETTFPVKVGPDLTFNGGTYDVYVAKVNPSGTNLVYCGYIGGSSDEYGNGIAVDGSGNAYSTGETYSNQTTFPVKVGPDLTYNSNAYINDAFVAKISSYAPPLNAPALTSPANGAVGQTLSANLQWQDTNSDPQEQGYKIRIKKSGGSYTYYTGAQDPTSYQLTPLAINTLYYWNVQAMGDGTKTGDSAWANSGTDWSFKTIAKATLKPLIMLSPGNGAAGQFTTLAFQWQDTNSAPQEIKCKIRIKAAGKGYIYYSLPVNSTSCTVSKLSPNTSYSWNVQALGNGTTIITSAWANSGTDWTFTTSPPVTLATPTLTAPSNGSTGQPFELNLQWSDPNTSPQEGWYKIRIRLAGGAYTYISTGQNITSVLKTGLAASKTYSWNVQAVGDGTGILSSAWANGGVDRSFTTSAPVTLNPPVLLAPADNAIDQPLSVTLQWTDTNTTFQERGYQIRIKPAGGAYTNVTTVKNAISYLKKGLVKNKTYYWNVRAKGTGTSTKDSAWANAGVDWKFTTIK